MELRVLQYFLAVAKAQSISGAAEALQLTQPTLSRQLKELEDELGKQLLIRGSRRVTLTEEGLLLRRRAEEILRLVQQTEQELTPAADAVTGTISIGSAAASGVPQLAAAMQRVRQEHPGVRYQLTLGAAHELLEQLHRGLLDFAVLPSPADLHRCSTLPLAPDPWGLLAPSAHPLAQLQGAAPDAVRGVPLILCQSASAEAMLPLWLQPGAGADVVARCADAHTAVLLTRQGLGCAVLPQAAAPRDDALRFVPLQPPLTSAVQLAWADHRPLSRAAEALLRQLQASSS